ncbi:hypothetical protein GCM10010361_46760 [Streptomyces olivaceiscleroticus]|uniref:Uncharacterized protein n=1 Tax=Streptomyces olivaceiscleroticus TaxID=68245 RepID=A0ABN1AHX7_9ACTN
MWQALGHPIVQLAAAALLQAAAAHLNKAAEAGPSRTCVCRVR